MMMNPEAVTLCSPTWEIGASYGRYAQEVRRALTDLGVHVNTIGTGAPEESYRLTSTNLIIGYPTSHHYYGALSNFGTKVALVMFESTTLPDGWAEILNTCAAVIVPCHWNERVFRDNGVEAPIYVLPLGLSAAFQPVRRRESDVFRFLMFGDRGERKGWAEGLNAFLKAFDQRADVRLTIKFRHPLPDGYPLKHLSNANIRVVDEDYDDERLAAFYGQHDALIFAASGEAWGWPPREMAATGGLAIATDYGGLSDDLPLWGIGVKAHEVPAWSQHREHQGLGVWGQADEDDLVEKLIAVRAMSYEQRLRAGQAYSANALGLYRWSDYGRRLLGILQTARAPVQEVA